MANHETCKIQLGKKTHDSKKNYEKKKTKRTMLKFAPTLKANLFK